MSRTYRNQWRLLGFDAREDPRDPFTPPLPPEMREEFLLRPEVENPFSVDTHIWPSPFLYFPQAAGSRERNDLGRLPVDPDCGGGLWLSLSRMGSRLAGARRRRIPIAVELLALPGAPVDEYSSPLIDSQPDPPAVPAGSVVLGHDVADVGFWSGLSNCGYSEDELPQLRREWSGRMNDFGLLATESDCLAFKEISDRRVPEHAPFWVYRLHRLPLG